MGLRHRLPDEEVVDGEVGDSDVRPFAYRMQEPGDERSWWALDSRMLTIRIPSLAVPPT